MSGDTDPRSVYSAIEESARLIDVTSSREDVWPVLTTYEDALTEAVIVFSVATSERHAGELDYTITVPAEGDDPYALALANGLTEETDHPVGSLLSDVREQCPVAGYAIDAGVVGGFKKIYTFFPQDDLQGLAKLSDIPSMPRSLAKNAGLFERHGLDGRVTMLGIDYQRRSVNLYFGRLPAECLEPETILSLLREIGLPEPKEEMLEFAGRSFAIYATLTWDSSEIERICFAVPPGPDMITLDPSRLPARVEPKIERFATNSPYAYDGPRMLVYGITWSPGGEYYKLGSYYQLPPQTRKLLVAFNGVGEEA